MPIVKLPDKNLQIHFPDDMSHNEIERVILTKVYGEDVISQGKQPELNLLEKGMEAVNTAGKFYGLEKPIFPIAKKDGISDVAKTQALINLQAKEEGVSPYTYREAPEVPEQAAEKFVSGYTAGVYPAFRNALTGEESWQPESFAGKTAAELSELGGMITGFPGAVGRGVSGVVGKLMPEIVSGLIAKYAPEAVGKYAPKVAEVFIPKIEQKLAPRVAKTVASEALNLVPMFTASEFGKALEKTNVKDSMSVLKDAAGNGALTALTFGVSKGLFPKNIQQRAARIITGLALLNAQRAVQDPENALWKRPLPEMIKDTVMDVFFLWHGLGEKGLKKIETDPDFIKIEPLIKPPPGAPLYPLSDQKLKELYTDTAKKIKANPYDLGAKQFALEIKNEIKRRKTPDEAIVKSLKLKIKEPVVEKVKPELKQEDVSDAEKTGKEAGKGSDQERTQGGEEERLRLRDDEKTRLEAEAGKAEPGQGAEQKGKEVKPETEFGKAEIPAEENKPAPKQTTEEINASKPQHPEAPVSLYHRFKHDSEPMSSWGHAIFAKDIEDVRNGNYGKNYFSVNEKEIPKENIIDADSEVFKSKLKKALKEKAPDKIEELTHDGYSADDVINDLVKESDPKRIVDSAGIWDSDDFFQIIWDEVLEPNGWDAVKTSDGLIVFNEKYIKSEKTKPSKQAEPAVKATEAEPRQGAEQKREEVKPETEPARPARESKGKEPWKMTREEWVETRGKKVSGQSAAKTKKLAPLLHKDFVKIWLSEGKPVPREVLKEYTGEAWADEALMKMEKPTDEEAVKLETTDYVSKFLEDKKPREQGLVKKRLNKIYRFTDGVMSIRERIEKLYKDNNLKIKVSEESKIKPMSRLKYFRATQQEQDAHERKIKAAGKKKVYYINNSDLGKIAYDYASFLLNRGNKPAETVKTKPEQSKPLSKKEKSLKEYREYVDSLTDEQRDKLKPADNPKTPTIALDRLKKQVAIGDKKSEPVKKEKSNVSIKFSPEQAIKLVADDIEDLRVGDIYRLMSENVNHIKALRSYLENYIKENHPENKRMLDEIDNIYKELTSKDEIKETGGKKKTVLVDMPKQKADGLSPKEQKKYLLEEITEAIKNAKEGALHQVYGKENIARIKEAHDKNVEEYGTVTIKVPGGGEFIIINNKDSLKKFEKDVKSKFPITAKNKKASTLKIKQTKGARIVGKDVSYYNPYIVIKRKTFSPILTSKDRLEKNNGWFSNMYFGVKISDNRALTKLKVRATNRDIAGRVKDFAKKANIPVQMFETWDGALNEIYKKGVVDVVGENGKHLLCDAGYIDAILTQHPDAKAFVASTDEKLPPVVFKVKKEPVGIVMPLKIDNEEIESLSKKYKAFVNRNKESDTNKHPAVKTEYKSEVKKEISKAIETKKTDKGVDLYSQSTTSSKASTVLNVVAEGKKFLGKGYDNLVKAGKLEVKTSGDVPENAKLSKAKRAPRWYSAFQKTVEGMNFKAMPAKDLVSRFIGKDKDGNRISKVPGVKLAELDWMGLEDWASGKKKVTKQELLDFIAANGVQIKEVVKGEELTHERLGWTKRGNFYRPSSEFENVGKIEYLPSNGKYVYESGTRNVYDTLQDAKDALLRIVWHSNILKTKYAKHQEPGGKNYREILMMLPVRTDYGKYNVEKLPNGEISVKNEDGDEIFRDSESFFNVSALRESIISKEDAFRSSHFGMPNVVAHARINERTISDVNEIDRMFKKGMFDKTTYNVLKNALAEKGHVKILFGEEYQSDWAQEGRKKGFKKSGRLKNASWKIKYEPDSGQTFDWNVYKDGELYSNFPDEKQAKDAVDGYKDGSQEEFEDENLPPDMPYKQTSQWTELLFKRMVRYAAENGFDALAWTPGKIQADRYDLSKYIDKIDVTRGSSKKNWQYKLDLHAKDGKNFTEYTSTKEEMEDLVGKELSDKIIKDNITIHNTKTYSSLDLKVGGEGMIAFYDRILPAVANKFFGKKKWGKARVGTIEIGYKGKSYLYSGETELAGPFDTREEAETANEELYGGSAEISTRRDNQEGTKGLKVWLLPITPEMRSKALGEGMPLFSQDGKRVTGFYHNGKITLYTDNMKPGDTEWLLRHEGMHMLMREDPEFKKDYDKILSDFESLKDRDRVTESFKKVPEDTPDEFKREEAFGYWLEDRRNHKHSLFKRFIAAIRRWARKIAIPLKMNDADLAINVTEGFKRYARRGKFEEVKNQPKLYSKAELPQKYKDVIEDTKDFIKDKWEKYKSAPEETNFKKALGNYLFERMKTTAALKKRAKAINENFTPEVQEGITNFIEADGDRYLLRKRMEQTKDKDLKAGYKAALNLSLDEMKFAKDMRNHFDEQLDLAIKEGVLDKGVENFVHHIWKKDNKFKTQVLSEINAGLLRTNPSLAKKRIFETFFAGEQAGKIPKDKRIGFLVTAYDLALNEAIASRRFVKDLLTRTAKDGRPLAVVSGEGRPIKKDEATTGYLIRPGSKVKVPVVDKNGVPLVDEYGKKIMKDTKDYKPVEHPALKKWKWVTKDADGNPIYLEGGMIVHPEIYKHMKNMLTKSAIQQHPAGKTALKVSSLFKQGLLSFSGFHQTQISEHALAHKVSPFNLKEIDFNDPVIERGVKNGLMVHDYDAMREFSEGLASSEIVSKVPFFGRFAAKYQDYLFGDFIPRVKVAMYKEAYKRNLKRYKNLSKDQVAEITAKQANAAFGGLNYKWLGRNKTLQDMFRLAVLAPDFLEARTKFAAQALKPEGKGIKGFNNEQMAALFRGAFQLYAGAALINMLLSDGHDPHLDKPFIVVYKGKEYTLRSVPGDLIHLYRDPRSFVYWRLNPAITKPTIEALTGRDVFGTEKKLSEQIKDWGKSAAPIPLQGPLWRKNWSVARALLQSIGVTSWKHRTAAEEKERDFLNSRPHGKLTDKGKKQYDVKQRLKKKLLSGADRQIVFDAVNKGEITSRQGTFLLRTYNQPDLVRDFNRLTLVEALAVWDKATKEEKKLLRKFLLRKGHLLKTTPQSEKKALLKRWKTAINEKL